MSWQNWQESLKEQQFDMRRKVGTALPQRSIRLDARYTSALARLFFLWIEHEKSRPRWTAEETKKAVGGGTERRDDMTGEFVEHYARISLFYHSERYERNERLAVLLAFQ